jgi:hypothetical protein
LGVADEGGWEAGELGDVGLRGAFPVGADADVVGVGGDEHGVSDGNIGAAPQADSTAGRLPSWAREDPELLTTRIGNPSLLAVESGFPAITQPQPDHDDLPYDYELGTTATPPFCR